MTLGRKDDRGKSPLSLIPQRALQEVASVFGHGRDKYGLDNWRHVRPVRRYYDESGYRHLAHAAASVLIALELEIEGAQIDEE